MKTCLCRDPKVTYTHNPTTGEGLYLCQWHAFQHREGHGFPVMPYHKEQDAERS